MEKIKNRNYRLEHLKVIDKRKARKLYNNRRTIYILGNNLNAYSMEYQLTEIKGSEQDLVLPFDSLVQIETKKLRSKWDGTYLRFYYIE